MLLAQLELCVFSLTVLLAKVGLVAWLIYQGRKQLPPGYTWLQSTLCLTQVIAVVIQIVFAMLSDPGFPRFIWGVNGPFIVLIATFTCGGVSVPSIDRQSINLK